MIWTIDQAEEYLNEIAEEFPPQLFEELNGGVNLLENAVPDPEFAGVYVLGQYCQDGLGNYINLYYGSFAAVAEQEHWTGGVWMKELRDTLSHELTHHMEYRSGLHALEDRDEEQVEQLRSEGR